MYLTNIRVGECDKDIDDEGETTQYLTSGKDDRVFRLDRVDAAACTGMDNTPSKDDTPVQGDMFYIALTTRQCGKTRGVIWTRRDGKDFYVTGETRVNGTFPRLKGKFVYDAATGELTRDGKPCKHVESARMIEDRFGLPVFQVGPDNRDLWWLVRVLLKDKSIGEIILPAGDQKERCSSISVPNTPAVEHGWCAANVLPYCVDDDNFGDELVKMTPPTGFKCRPWDEIRKRLMNHSAKAAPPTYQLPSEMLGKWCSVGNKDTLGFWTFNRAPADDWDNCNGSISRLVLDRSGYVEQDGNSGPTGTCRAVGPVTLIKSYERRAEAEFFYKVRYKCRTEGFATREDMLVRYSDETGELIKRNKVRWRDRALRKIFQNQK